jgi:DNA-binding MarR family transcriptional regulator
MHRILSSHLQTEMAKLYKLTPTELRVLFAIDS